MWIDGLWYPIIMRNNIGKTKYVTLDSQIYVASVKFLY